MRAKPALPPRRALVSADYAVIGQRLPKRDAAAKVIGRAIYGHDLVRPGMLYGAILRSPHAHARLTHLDTTAAARLPGVYAVLTASDVPARPFGFARDSSIIKGPLVLRVGDEVAAVAAATPDLAAEALRMMVARYDLLPALFDPLAALSPGALCLHPEHGSNLYRRQVYSHGDVDAALAQAELLVEDEFELPHVSLAPMEPAFCLAEFDPQGDLLFYSTTQAPFQLQHTLAAAVGISPGRVRVLQTVIGGAFGRGLDTYAFEAIAALLARAAGRPVRLAFDRREEFAAMPLRQPVRLRLRSGARQDGTLWVRDAQATLDIGAYASLGTMIPAVMAEAVASLYRVPHARFAVDLVYTNNPMTGAMRGFGGPQATFAVEVHMDRLAAALGVDPLDFRRQNANRPGEVTPQGLRFSTCGLEPCLALAGEWVAERRLSAQPTPSSPGVAGIRRGLGLAAALNVGGGARMFRSDGAGAVVKVDDYGHVTLLTGATDMGQGADVVLAQIVAEMVGVRVDDVTVVNGDTAVVPWDVGAHASRTTFVAGQAALQAAAEARRQILETASEMLEAAPEDLDVRGGWVFVRGMPKRALALDKVIRARHFRPVGGRIVVGQGWYDPPNENVNSNLSGNLSATYSFSAQAAEVEVDLATGRVRVLGIYAASDVGQLINPMVVEGQLQGSIHMGLGYALSEQAFVEHGRVTNDSLRESGLLTAVDMPEIELRFLVEPDPLGPYGAKGAGELGILPVAPAVANAIYDAVGIRLTRLPFSPERVWTALAAGKFNHAQMDDLS
jgi:CO/xanthine dehydrogenase Mo-binding subunit